MLRAVAGGGSGSGGGGPQMALAAWGTLGGTGLVNGSATESGDTWSLTGEGFNTAIRNPGGFATCPLNTYMMLNNEVPTVKATQVFEGPDCTLAIINDGSLSDMVHVNFTKGDPPFVMFWKTGVGPSQFPTYERNYADIPTTPGPMEFSIVVINGFVYSYAAGILCSVCWDAEIVGMAPILTGAFAQLHEGAADKVYSLHTYIG